MARSTDTPTPGAERIAKLLARAGIASRREIERMIAEGRVALGGVAVDTPATLLASLDGLTVDGQPVAAAEPTRLFLYHKPPGLLVTERDPRGRPTIYDRLPIAPRGDLPRVVPVGRLDLNTEGLLLLTTDGGFKRQLELPATGVERTYRARAYGPITQARLEELIDGIEIDGMRYGSIDANLERRTGANVWIELTLTEGKNREVRRVLEYLGLEVSRLIRTRYGPFLLGDLPAGAVGEVKGSDIVAFRRTLKGGAPAEPIAAEPRPGFRQVPTTDRARRSAATARASNSPASTKAHPHPSGATRLPPSPMGRGKGAAIGGGKGEGEAARASRAPSGAPRTSAKPMQRDGLTTQHGLRPTHPAKPAARPAPARQTEVETTPSRPAKLQRKAGWAKPKPKPGPARPRKPRA